MLARCRVHQMLATDCQPVGSSYDPDGWMTAYTAPSDRLGARRLEPLVYSHAMATASATVKPHGRSRLLSWGRVRFTLGISALFGLLLSVGNETATIIVIARAMFVGFAVMLAFG